MLTLTRSIRHILLVDALVALPDFAAAQGSQAGGNGRQPAGADNDSPRQAIPNATFNDGTPYRYDRRARVRCNPESRGPLAERPGCRDAVHGRHH